MRLWRLSTAASPRGAFDGEGARVYGGRWNTKGTPLVYTSGSLSLAALEMLVHTDAAFLVRPLFAFHVDVPDAAIETLLDSALPRNWRHHPFSEETQRIGSRWAEKRESLALAVPSAIIPAERNYLLNTAHPGFAALTVPSPDSFAFDPRLR
jgi:RES domain-containing protein